MAPWRRGAQAIGRRGARPVAAAVPVSIYVADDQAYAYIEDGVEDALAAFDIEIVERFPEICGSVFRVFLARTRGFFNSAEMKDRYAKIERAIELQAIYHAQAEVDSLQSAAVANLITALGGTSDAIIQIGSVLLIKANGVTAVRNLTQQELAHLERNPDVFRDPTVALRELQRINQEVKQLSSE